MKEYISDGIFYSLLGGCSVADWGEKINYYLSNYLFTEDQLYTLAPLAGYYQWIKISMHQELSENFIRNFANHLLWDRLIRYQKNITLDLIREFQDEFDDVVWKEFCIGKKLHNNVIREWKDKVDWSFVAKFGKFDFNFVKEWKDELKYYIDNSESPKIILTGN